MARKYFLKNLVFFLLPLLAPLLILGVFALALLQGNIKSNLEKSNLNLLTQTKANVDLILNEIDSLGLYFDKDPKIVKRLKDILSKKSLSLEELDSLDFIKNTIETTANSKPYLYSIYIYFERGGRNFFSSTQGLSNLDRFDDTSWYPDYFAMKARHNFWCKKRLIKQYPLDTKDTAIISIAKKLYSPGSLSGDGVLVLNILPGYVNHILKNLAVLKDQTILVLDETDEIVFQNAAQPYLANMNISRFKQSPQAFFSIVSDRKRYSISVIHSDRHGWSYISIVPNQSLYQPLSALVAFTVFLLILSLMLGTALTYSITRKKYRQLERVLKVIDAAKSGSPLPPLPERAHDEYDYIIQSLLTTFIEQNYLKIQLSERKYKLQASEFKALQSQINPHFLYNTLHTIYWEVLNLTGQPNKANQMIANLTDILEYSLSRPNDRVTLAEEIKNARSYIEIQQIRYQNLFEVIWEYDEADLQIKTVKLLLQPLIENSIYHGIKEQGGGVIKIKLKHCKACLKISVIDNGIGISKAKLQEIRKQLGAAAEPSQHIGVYNTHKRLQIYYGSDSGLRVISKPNFGTAVIIKIPLA
ncbi:two-component system sensor histidine kinase YesM [Hydrogenispora ethanolica]|uniref:Two-component system sensor histidine kinase YesM n=1 Tax=Hydrogenispora ethanolica TaxID=1082276 RepID=A0A4V2QC31_HYDET|nr:sensor histidine kinase [Hydrogenispora ethanolica]TCL58347.1 two-component system sensor histidine kinase YesM [Hydrogenispora ethanolica]